MSRLRWAARISRAGRRRHPRWRPGGGSRTGRGWSRPWISACLASQVPSAGSADDLRLRRRCWRSRRGPGGPAGGIGEADISRGTRTTGSSRSCEFGSFLGRAMPRLIFRIHRASDGLSYRVFLQPVPGHAQRQQWRAQQLAAGEGDVRHLGEQVEAVAAGRRWLRRATAQRGASPRVRNRPGRSATLRPGRRPICGRRLAPMPIMPPHW